MFDVLKELAKSIDTVVVVGIPNLKFFLKIGLGGMAIVYRGSTDECKIVLPFKEFKIIEKLLPRKCEIVMYSYDAYQLHGYVIARNFNEVLQGVLKTITKIGEEIGVPLYYMDSTMYLTLSKFWKLRDISKDIRILRSKKNTDIIKDLIEIHNAIKEFVERCKDEGIEVVKCLLANAIDVFDDIGFNLMTKSKDLITLKLTFNKTPYTLDYTWSIALSKQIVDIIQSVDQLLSKNFGNYYSKLCSDLVKAIKMQLQHKSLKAWIDICGVGTEPCEYPSLSECLYESIVIDDGMVLKIETIVNESIYVPKLFVVKNKNIEVY